MAEWKCGQVILGEYTVEKELGHGGMGVVWLVKSNSTGRRFAVKQTLLKDEKHRKAFLAELQTWIDLPEHPNIVPCRFFRTVADETVIFADYVEGGSLADWIAKGKLTKLEQILDIAIQFAWGLHAIHERGLIHQDVKPGNVLMTPEGVPMVTDFGLARARRRAADGAFLSPSLPPGQQSVLVSSGGMTLAYASPEQRSGKPLSRKTDIWSWGVSVLDMFMGGVSCPHGGHIAAHVLQSLIENGDCEEGLPAIPNEVATTLRKCFSDNPNERWNNLYVISMQLRLLYERISRRFYQHQKSHVLGSTIGHVEQHDRLTPDGGSWKDPELWLRAVERLVGCDPPAGKALGTNAQSRVAQAVGDLATYAQARSLLEAFIAEGNHNHELLLAELLADEAVVHFGLNDFPGALGCYDKVTAIREHAMQSDGPKDLCQDLATAYGSKSVVLARSGQFLEAAKLTDKTIEILERMISQEVGVNVAVCLANAYLNKTELLRETGRDEEALVLCDRVVEIGGRSVKQDGRDQLDFLLAGAYHTKALLLRTRDCGASLEAYRQAAAILEQLLTKSGWEHIRRSLASIYIDQSIAASGAGDAATALVVCDKGIGLLKHLIDGEGRRENADSLATAYTIKERILRTAGDLPGAMEACENAIGLFERLVNLEGRQELAEDLNAAYSSKACFLLEVQRDLDGALEVYNKVVVAREYLARDTQSPALADNLHRSRLNRANCLRDLGRPEQALPDYDKAINAWQQKMVSGFHIELANDLARAYMDKSMALRIIGDLRGASEAGSRAVAIREQVATADPKAEAHTVLADTCFSEATVRCEVGDLAGALALFDKTIAIRHCYASEDNQAGTRALAEAHVKRASVLCLLGRSSEAESSLGLSIKIFAALLDHDNEPQTRNLAAYACELLGSMRLGKNDTHGALEAFRKQLEYAPNTWNAYNNVGYCLLILGEHRHAVEYCQKAVRLNEQSFDAWDSLGSAYIQTGEPEKAETALKKALALNPKHVPAMKNLAELYEALGRSIEAKGLRQQIVAVSNT